MGSKRPLDTIGIYGIGAAILGGVTLSGLEISGAVNGQMTATASVGARIRLAQDNPPKPTPPKADDSKTAPWEKEQAHGKTLDKFKDWVSASDKMAKTLCPDPSGKGASQADKDKAVKDYDAARKNLDAAVSDEAELAPEVQQAKADVQKAAQNSALTNPNASGADRAKAQAELNEAGKKYKEKKDKEFNDIWEDLGRPKRKVECPPPGINPFGPGLTPPILPYTPDDSSPFPPNLTGLFLGGELTGNFGSQRIDERLASNGTLNNRLSDGSSALAIGFLAGYNFALTPNVFAGPFASFDVSDQKINRNFGGGTFIGSTTNWVLTAGAQIGVTLSSTVAVYALAGVSVLNEDLKINFGGPVTSENRTVAGLTVGGGIEARPRALQSFGAPVALFAQYQYTWYDDARLTMPAASPAFDYTYRWHDFTAKFGAKVYLDRIVASDARLKRDIVALARLDNGIGLYRYRYLWSPEVYVGVMAQEVAAVIPDAVVRFDDGYLGVDYGRLGLRLQTWDEWRASN